MVYAGSPAQLNRKAGSSRDIIYFDIRKQGRQKGSRVGPCRLSSGAGKRYISRCYSLPIADRTRYRGFGRGALEELNRRRFDQSLDGGDFTQALVGRSDDGLVETIMSLASEMPFDGEGQSSCPSG